MSSFADRLRLCRQNKGLTQKQMAAICKVTERHYQVYESGANWPRAEGLMALADFFDVSLDYLVGRSDNPARH
jgi:transcriptional regulator with XRE-family HTH domain